MKAIRSTLIKYSTNLNQLQPATTSKQQLFQWFAENPREFIRFNNLLKEKGCCSKINLDLVLLISFCLTVHANLFSKNPKQDQWDLPMIAQGVRETVQQWIDQQARKELIEDWSQPWENGCIFESIGFQLDTLTQAFPKTAIVNDTNLTNEQILILLGTPAFYHFLNKSAQRCQVTFNSFPSPDLSEEAKNCVAYLARDPNIHTIHQYTSFLTLALQTCLEHDLKNTLNFFDSPSALKSARN